MASQLKIILLFLAHLLLVSSCGKNRNNIILGTVAENISSGDSIFFTKGLLHKKFYEIPRLSSVVTDKHFNLSTDLSYPHLYTVSFESERGKIPYRGGDYFFDSSTSSITVSALKQSGCNTVESEAHKEYREKFIPFMTDNNLECKGATITSLGFKDPDSFDVKLQNYILKNPNSYVALWSTIYRIRFEGFSERYNVMLQSFSNSMKQKHLWKLAYEDLMSIRISKGKKFPSLSLKNHSLEREKLEISGKEFTLIYYWFHNCKPCLSSFPKLKLLYDEYRNKGFEIVNISTDSDKNILNWKQKINEYQLSWKHYLDINGTESKKDKITTFPTTFLLDSDGVVIEKNLSLEQLETFLKSNLED